MKQLIRWKYVLPRLTVLYALYLLVFFGLDPLLQYAITASGEAAVGAKVEITAVTSALGEGKITLQELAIANPQAPMRNLLESSEARLQLDVSALLHGRLVVEDGTLSGLQFDTDRETSGALVIEPTDEETGPSVLDPMLASASEMGAAWLAGLDERLNANVLDQLESPKLAKQLEERWPTQYRELQTKVTDIRSRGKQLQAEFREAKKNPLRGLERIGEIQQELTTLLSEMNELQQQLAALPKQAEEDRKLIVVAREQDEKLLRQQLQFTKLDGDGLTQTLLGKPVTDKLASALDWVAWARKQVPTSSKKAKSLRSRGSTILFTERKPDLWIKRLQLAGVAQLGGEPLPWVGTLTDVSDTPKLIAEPTRLTLSGSEAGEFTGEIVLDRRDEQPTDRLHLSCPHLSVGGRSLGKLDKLAIDISPGSAEIEIDLHLQGDQLEGSIVYAQPSFELSPRLSAKTNKHVSEALTAALAGVDTLKADVTLTGTLQKPQIDIDSQIGSQIAAGLNSSVQRMLEQRSEALLADARLQVDAQLKQLAQLREQAQQQLLAQLDEGKELLGQLAPPSGGKGLSGIPQIGQALRLGTKRK